MIPGEDELSRMISGLRVGDPQIQMEFWNRYGPLLQQTADRNLGQGMRRRFGPEDVAQSVCRTFFRRVQGGEFQLEETDALWSLLCAITLTKLREKARFHLRQKRGLQYEETVPEGGENDSGLAIQSNAPTPAESAEFADLLETVLAELDEEERQVLQLKLQDFTHEEVAQQLKCSERTVRRLLKRVQAQLERALQAE